MTLWVGCALPCPYADERRPVLWRQRLAGYLNFIRPCLRMPLELVRAVHDGDLQGCMGALPFITDSAPLSAIDLLNCRGLHDRAVYVDATPGCISIVQQGCLPVTIRLPVSLPIYVSKYLAALTAVLSRDMYQTALYSDNLGVVFNLRKGRCPRPHSKPRFRTVAESYHRRNQDGLRFENF